MNPVSRKRKRKKTRKRPGGARPSGLADIGRTMLREYVGLAKETDPLVIEMATSVITGSWWSTPETSGPEALDVGMGVLGYAATKTTPAALALNRAMEVLGDGDEERARARAAAEVLAAKGVQEPVWGSLIGQVEVGRCWQLVDVFGDKATVLCEFSYGTERHGLFAEIDFAEDAAAMYLDVTDDVDETLARLRDGANESDGLSRVESLDPARARRLIAEGVEACSVIALIDALTGADVVKSVRDLRALALARCRTMPRGDEVPEVREYADSEIAELADEFLAAEGIRPDYAARICARAIIEYGCFEDRGQPDRVGPEKLNVFLGAWAPVELEWDEEVAAAMPEVIRAWTWWAAARRELPSAAEKPLKAALEDGIAEFAEAYEFARLDAELEDDAEEFDEFDDLDGTVEERRERFGLTGHGLANVRFLDERR